MTPYESRLAAALSPDTAPQPDQLKAALLAVYAKFDLFDGTVHQKAALHLHLDGLLASLATKAMPTQMIKTDRRDRGALRLRGRRGRRARRRTSGWPTSP